MEADNLSDAELNSLIICKKCATLHKKIELEKQTKATCQTCKSTLYRKHLDLLDKSLALTLAMFIFFIVANLFPIVTINLQGAVSEITLSSVFLTMFLEQFYFTGLMCAFLIFILPITFMSLFLALLIFMKLRIYENAVKKMLVFLSSLLPWNMVEIFLISILIAMVKLIGYAEIHLGVSFWALVLFVIVDMYISKNINMLALWNLKENVYEKSK